MLNNSIYSSGYSLIRVSKILFVENKWCFSKLHTALTYLSWGCVFVSILIELPGSHWIHLDEGDAPTAPLLLWLVDREKGLKEQIDNTLGDWMGINSQAGQQVVRVAHVPELESGTQEEKIREKTISLLHMELTDILYLNCVSMWFGWITSRFSPRI